MRKKLRWAPAPTFAAVLAAALWLLVPPAFGGTADTPQEAGDPCRLAQPQPASPLEMNTVTVDSLFKTVVMEKEVFVCANEPGAPASIRDVETFIEIVELATRDGARVVEKRVESATCDKNPSAAGVTVKCNRAAVPLGPPGNPAIPGTCTPSLQQPSDPVEMNTAVGPKDRLVKTIKVEKEVFDCDQGTVVGDLYLFTEIIEAPSETARGLPTVRPIAKRFEGIVCFKSVSEGRLIGCRQVGPLS
ncbi:MAG: hypothetical protein DMF83_17280 [Acidobacteria bacterium]|nr:MAG: hypothetical protein DMF83_17280 [Acidobacteriota bacterium]